MTLFQSLQEHLQGRHMGEEALVDAARRGSRPAFDALVHTHESRLRGFLIRQIGTQAAEDVLQETWIAGWAALPRYAGRAGFKAWLYGIAVHKCRDHQRRQARERAAAASLWEEGRYAEPSWSDQIAQRETVREALGRLPEAQREVLELYYYAELTLPEVAASLARNLNTVKYQFYRAHTQVAGALEEAEAAPGE